ncbi:MAG: hypothetical protein MSG64_16700 [Pyrinomonadaceae bacterium MAG19_C2-C3]|nr:hypothetical protein [Pyrinomonadaceae bacterium MAG19_C2-C3]
MSVATVIPSVWAAALLASLKKAHVYAQEGVVNRDYEGEIAQAGDSVRINSIGSITTFDVTRNTDIPDPETLTAEQQTLLIDQSKGFNFQVDDADKVQARPNLMEAAMEEAGFALRDAADLSIAGLYTGVAAGNTIGTDLSPIVPTAETAYEYLVDLDVKLSEANVPSAGRWVVVPAWFHGLLRKDKRFVEAGTAAGDMVRVNGEIGMAGNFRVLMSNNVPNATGTKYKIMAGHRIAITYAEQIASIEAYRMEKRFADALKGLHLYGRKLIRPTAIAVLTANRA